LNGTGWPLLKEVETCEEARTSLQDTMAGCPLVVPVSTTFRIESHTVIYERLIWNYGQSSDMRKRGRKRISERDQRSGAREIKSDFREGANKTKFYQAQTDASEVCGSSTRVVSSEVRDRKVRNEMHVYQDES
jgi:hypothetical protein